MKPVASHMVAALVALLAADATLFPARANDSAAELSVGGLQYKITRRRRQDV